MIATDSSDSMTPQEIGELLKTDTRPALRKTDLHRRDLDEAIEIKKAHFHRTISILQSVRRMNSRKTSEPGKRVSHDAYYSNILFNID